MLSVRYLTKFKRDLKRLKKQHKDMSKLKTVIDLLINEQPLPADYHDHALSNNWKDFRDCHIELDWILIYRIEKGELQLILARTGSHSELDL